MAEPPQPASPPSQRIPDQPPEKLTSIVKRFRKLLPGDERFGDPLSTAGEGQASVIGRNLAEATRERPSLLREAGLSALQVWDALSRDGDVQVGTEELAIVFTDLVNFSKWALEAGDGPALALLRDVGEAIEPPVRENGGTRGEAPRRRDDGRVRGCPGAAWRRCSRRESG